MEQQNNTFIHDTINLDEIRRLLDDSGAPAAPVEPKPVSRPLPEKQEAVLEDVQLEEAEPTEEDIQQEPKSFAYELYGMLHDLVYILAFGCGWYFHAADPAPRRLPAAGKQLYL